MLSFLNSQPVALFYLFGGLVGVVAAVFAWQERRREGKCRRSTRTYLVFLTVMAVASLSFPTISQYFFERSSYAIIENDTEDYSSLISQAHEYNQGLVATSYRYIGDPATGNGTTDESYGRYEQLLKPKDSDVLGTLDIPSIDVHLPIRHGTSPQVLDEGVGHIYQTALPVGGKGTHSALTAHTGLAGKRLFTDLADLEIGQTWTVNVLGEQITYKAVKREVVLPTQLESLTPVAGRDLMSLITCTPAGLNSHRLIVTGERIR